MHHLKYTKTNELVLKDDGKVIILDYSTNV